MRIALIIPILAVIFTACGGGTSPEQACRDAAPVTCEKMWTCNAAVKIGSDQASCVTQSQSFCALAGTGCSGGKKFDGAKAAECNAAKQAQTCTEYTAGEPAVCAQICT